MRLHVWLTLSFEVVARQEACTPFALPELLLGFAQVVGPHLAGV